MSPVKIIKGVALASLLVAASSVIQELLVSRARGWAFESGDVYDILFRVMVFGYASMWMGTLIFKTRGVVLLTSIVLFSPSAMIAYNMVAIWFEEKNTVLNAWITLCLGVGLVLYVRLVWHWWASKRTLLATVNEQCASIAKC
jgi:hypothetical protein